MDSLTRRQPPRPVALRLALGFAAALLGAGSPACAQQERADQLLNAPTDSEAAMAAIAEATGTSVPILELLLKGGWFMAPIVLISLVVVTVGIERGLGLCRGRVLPRRLLRELTLLAEPGEFDPRRAYEQCQRNKSPAGRVVQAMLLKLGRPHAEVEKAVADACQRESDAMYANVRTLNLAASIAPLLGMLGTVWGMIQAFMVTANLPSNAHKGEALAQGIYIALITTFAGLAVAIPAAMLAHLFEGRILKLLRQVEELAERLLPQVERYEGKVRLDRQRLESPESLPPGAHLRETALNSPHMSMPSVRSTERP